MSVKELAVILGKSIHTEYRMRRLTDIPRLKVGGCISFDPAALSRYFRKKAPQSAAAADVIAARVA